MLIKTKISKKNLELLLESIKNNDLFQIKEENVFTDMDLLLQRVINHLSIKKQIVDDIKKFSDEIIHFKHIKVKNFSEEEISSFKEKIDKVKNFIPADKKEIARKFAEGEIDEQEFQKQISALSEDIFKDLKIKKIARHYYLLIVYSIRQKADYINHIINTLSEIKFIENLEKYLQRNTAGFEWMFSKLDQNLDKFYIPYFHSQDNSYRKFYPDFIF